MDRILLVAGVALAACEPPCYPPAGRADYTSYPRGPEVLTPGGVRVEGEIDHRRLDGATAAVVGCLREVWPRVTGEDRRRSWCTGTAVLEVRTCLRVQVPPDWYVSPCSGAQLFPCRVPAESCLRKGLVPTAECPCACRAVVQGTDTVLTAPDLELYPARLTELLTGCDQIWETPLAACGSPALVPP